MTSPAIEQPWAHTRRQMRHLQGLPLVPNRLRPRRPPGGLGELSIRMSCQQPSTVIATRALDPVLPVSRVLTDQIPGTHVVSITREIAMTPLGSTLHGTELSGTRPE